MKKLLILMILLPLVCFGQTRPHITQTRPVENIAALRAITPTVEGTLAIVAGYTSSSDSGGGTFIWRSTSTVADDGGHVITPTGSVTPGRWHRIAEDKHAKHYGIFPGGSTCQAAAVITVLNSLSRGETLHFDFGDYYFEAPIIISKSIKLKGVGTGTANSIEQWGTVFKFVNSSGILVQQAYVSLEDLNLRGWPDPSASDVDPHSGDYGSRFGIDLRSKNDPNGYSGSASRLTGVGIRGFDTGIMTGHVTPETATGTYFWGGAYHEWINVGISYCGIGLGMNHYTTDVRATNLRFSACYAHSIFANSLVPYQNLTLTNSMLEAQWHGNLSPASASIYIGEFTKANFIGCYFEHIDLFNTTNSFVRFVGGHFQRSTTALHGLGEVAGLSTVFGDSYLITMPTNLAWERIASTTIWVPEIGLTTYVTNTVATGSIFRINADLPASDSWNIPQMTYANVLASGSIAGYREIPFLVRWSLRVESDPSNLTDAFLSILGIQTWAIDGSSDRGDASGVEFSRLAIPIDNSWHTYWRMQFARRSHLHMTPGLPVVHVAPYAVFGNAGDNFGVNLLKVHMLMPEVWLFRNRGSF